MEVARLYATITADTSGITAGLRQSDAALVRSARLAESSANAIKSAFRDVGGQLQTIGVGLTAALTAPLAIAAKVGLEFNAMKEQAVIAFTTMMGSSDQALAHLDALRKFADKTPFEFTDVISASKRFQAFGLAAQDVLPTLTAIGNAAAGTGQGQAAIDRLTLSLGQMLARGKITGEEFRELGASGVPALKFLAEAAGVTREEMRKLVEGGLVPADFALKAIVSGIEKSNIGGMMAKQSQSFLGLLSTLKDTVVGTLGDALQPLFQFMADGLRAAIPLVQQLGKMWTDLPAPIKNTVLAMAGIAAVAGPVLAAVGTIVAAVATIGAPVAATVGAVVLAVTEAAGVVALVWSTNFGGLRTMAEDAFSAVADFARQYGGELVGWWRQNLPLIRQTVATVLKAIEAFWNQHKAAILPIVKGVWEAVKFTIVNVTQIILGVVKAVMLAVNGNWRAAWGTFVSTAGTALDNLVTVILSKVSPTLSAAYSIGSAIIRGLTGGLAGGEATSASLKLPTSASLKLPPEAIPNPATAVPKLNLPTGGGGGGRGGGSATNAAADLLARLRDDTARLGATTREQETALDLLGKAYAKVTPAMRATILEAAREYDTRKALAEIQRQATDLIASQTDAIRGQATALDEVNAVLSNPVALTAIDSQIQAQLRLNAAVIDGRRLREEADKALADSVAQTMAAQGTPQAVKDFEAGILQEIDAVRVYESALDALNAKLTAKQPANEAERVSIEITTGALRDLNAAQKEVLLGLARQVDEQAKAAERLKGLKAVFDQFADVFKGAFDSLFTEGFGGFADKLRQGFAKLLSDLAAALVRAALFKLFNSLFGLTLGGGGGFGELFAGAFGGFRAEGGPILPGRAYLVGERGPEIVVPQSAGQVLPNAALAGGITVVNHFNISAPNGNVRPESQRQISARVGEAISAAMERRR